MKMIYLHLFTMLLQILIETIFNVAQHELIECITSEELFVDLNDDPQFRKAKLSELLTESKVVVYFPDYYLLVSRYETIF